MKIFLFKFMRIASLLHTLNVDFHLQTNLESQLSLQKSTQSTIINQPNQLRTFKPRLETTSNALQNC